MDPRPLIPPQPSSKMSHIARAIEMMANAIQQQNLTMNQNQMNKLDATRATASSCSSQPSKWV